MAGDPLYEAYHDTEWGVPEYDPRALWEKLALDGFQAGLSWITILRKRDAFRAAFDNFDPDKVALYGEIDRARLMADAGIIRNRLKVDAAIANAQRILELRKSHGGFHAWLKVHHPLTKEEWVKLFKKTFRFTGGEIVGEFLLSTGFLPGAHAPTCPIYPLVVKRRPAWKGA